MTVRGETPISAKNFRQICPQKSNTVSLLIGYRWLTRGTARMCSRHALEGIASALAEAIHFRLDLLKQSFVAKIKFRSIIWAS